jgi:hypothetical protein
VSIQEPKIPSPLTGEGKGGGEKLKVQAAIYQFPLPFIPSRQGRGGHLLMTINHQFVAKHELHLLA